MDRSWERLHELTGSDIPKAIGDYCWMQLATLTTQQRIYTGIYADARRVDVMNAASGLVSRIFQDSLFDSLVMGICRLLDPAQAGRQPFRNLSFDLLISHLLASQRVDEFKIRRQPFFYSPNL